ncbi:RNA methyltransferase [bacterium]|nr:RNA methyltransferase [bacterium]
MPSNYFLLNNIRSIENVGSIFRIADSLGWGVLVQGITPHPKVFKDARLPYEIKSVEKKLRKTAVKTLDTVNWEYFVKPEEAIRFTLEKKLDLYCLEEGVVGCKSIFDSSIKTDSFVLVLGNEVSGIEDAYLTISLSTFFIPMFGSNKSMNVAISGAIAGYFLKYRQIIVK